MDYFKILLLVLFTTLVSISQAHKLYVGGKDGWTLNPSENYNHWSQRYRFNINDTIVFKYVKGSDSVLEVNKEDYQNCNKTNPIKKFEDSETEFTLDRSGPFYFISGKDDKCEKGEKLHIVVISPPKASHSPPLSPDESLPSIAPSPEGPAKAPSHNSGSFVAPLSFMMYCVTIVVGALFSC